MTYTYSNNNYQSTINDTSSLLRRAAPQSQSEQQKSRNLLGSQPKNENMQSFKSISTSLSSMRSINDLEDLSYSNKVVYDSANHWGVLTQMNGSVWPKVIGFCIFNVFNTLCTIYVNKYYHIDISFSDRGHTFMSLMVSFLMVTRSNIAYSRYMEARRELAHCMTACRELISYATTFTRYDHSEQANHWRIDLTKRTIKLLSAMVSVLQYQSSGNHAWKIPALSIHEKKALQAAVGKSNERTPMILAMHLRSTIAANVECLENAIHPNKEMKLYSCVSDFVKGYHELMKLVTTPFPFPLVQMTRTFLFIWVFSLPWVLVNDLHKVVALVLTVFFITYAFVGLEYVAIELDDPFGDDPNDFDLMGLANVTFKDMYIFIYDLHGEKDSRELADFVDEANYKQECMRKDGLAVDNVKAKINEYTVKETHRKEHGSEISNLLRNESNKGDMDQRMNESSVRKTQMTPHSRHQRCSSLQAWEMAVQLTSRMETGSETSKLLLFEQNSEIDQIEANQDLSDHRVPNQTFNTLTMYDTLTSPSGNTKLRN